MLILTHRIHAWLIFEYVYGQCRYKLKQKRLGKMMKMQMTLTFQFGCRMVPLQDVPRLFFFELAHRLEGAFKIQAGMTKHPEPRNRPNKYQGVITTISGVTVNNPTYNSAP